MTLAEPNSNGFLSSSVWFDALWSHDLVNDTIIQSFFSTEALYTIQILHHLQKCKRAPLVSQFQI